MGLRESQREHTIGLIVAAAAEVFGRSGYHAASMEEVARATGCATATLYGYFSSKEALFARVLEELVGAYLRGVHDAIAGSEGFQGGVHAYFDHYLAFAERHQAFLRVMQSSMRTAQTATHPAGEQAEAFRAAYRRILQPVFARAADEGLIPGGLDPDPLFTMLTGLMHSSAFAWMVADSGDLAPAADAARAMFLAGFPAAVASLNEGASE
jgi:AcrR family transcriptional regulator